MQISLTIVTGVFSMILEIFIYSYTFALSIRAFQKYLSLISLRLYLFRYLKFRAFFILQNELVQYTLKIKYIGLF
jgi:hypothetical protein